MPEPAHKPIRSYGRIKARTLKPRQERLVETLLPRIAVDVAAPIDPHALFPDARACVLEIGFGGGEHLVAQAAAAPDHGFIGVEPFLNGVGSCLRHIDEAGVSNVRLHMGDARDVVAALPDASVDRVDILFPDPWPKARHHKRRLVQPEFVAALARVVKPGGGVRFATDWANYAEWTLEIFLRDPHFAWTAERVTDWTAPWAGHVTTRYEEKKLGDCAPVWLVFARRYRRSRARMIDSADLTTFWRAAGPAAWFKKDPAFDDALRTRFFDAHMAAARGELDHWRATADGALALLLLLDQIPRNIFRDTAHQFATDPLARRVADAAISAGHDRAVEAALQPFFYLPFEHSEAAADQARSVALFEAAGDAYNIKWAKLHADIITRFGRFPHRNAVLARETTAEEAAFLEEGGFAG